MKLQLPCSLIIEGAFMLLWFQNLEKEVFASMSWLQPCSSHSLVSIYAVRVAEALGTCKTEAIDRGKRTATDKDAGAHMRRACRQTNVRTFTHTHTHAPRSPRISKVIGLLTASFGEAGAVSGMDRAWIACLRCTDFGSRNVKSQG